METNDKITLIRDLLGAWGSRSTLSGAQFCDSLTKEESIRRSLDPEGVIYSKEDALTNSVALRIRALPFIPGKTKEEYNDDMGRWLPGTFVRFTSSKTKTENIEGCAEAVYDVLAKYPRFVNHLKVYSTVDDVEERNVEVFPKNKILKKIKEDKDVINQVMAVVDADFDKNFKHIASITGKPYFIAKYFGLERDKEVKNIVSPIGLMVSADKFIEVLKKKYTLKLIEKNAKEIVEKEAKEKHIYSPRLSSGTYGCCSGGRYVYLSKKAREDIAKGIDEDTQVGWHPQGANVGAKSVMVHELGHAMDDLLGLEKDKEIIRIWKDYSKEKYDDKNYGTSPILARELSHYACTNICEMIAEGFCEYMISKSPRKVATLIGNRVDTLYFEKFGERVSKVPQ